MQHWTKPNRLSLLLHILNNNKKTVDFVVLRFYVFTIWVTKRREDTKKAQTKTTTTNDAICCKNAKMLNKHKESDQIVSVSSCLVQFYVVFFRFLNFCFVFCFQLLQRWNYNYICFDSIALVDVVFRFSMHTRTVISSHKIFFKESTHDRVLLGYSGSCFQEINTKTLHFSLWFIRNEISILLIYVAYFVFGH